MGISSGRSKEQVIFEMRKRGLRLTRPREAILDCLLETDEHPSARTIWERVKKKVPSVSLSTVYSTLSELTKNNIINELEFAETSNRYEGNLAHHINLICVQCGNISDYTTAHTLDLEQVKEVTLFKAFRARFELYGRCNKCSEE